MRINLFIFISNTYTSPKTLNGIIEERRKIIEVLGLNSLYDKIINSKFIITKKYREDIRFVKNIVCNNIQIKLKKSNILSNVTFERFLNGIIKKRPIYKLIQTEMCEKFPSIYISSEGISYLQRYPEQLEQYKIILDILKRRVSDLRLEDAVVRIKPTVIREK